MANPHDIIQFFPKYLASKTDEFRKLYESGRSLLEISNQYGIAKSSLRLQLIKSGVALRSREKNQKLKRKMPSRHHWGGIPYGYSMLDGRLVVDPREIKIVRRIIEQWQKVKRFYVVANWLNDQGIPSKLGKKWSDNAVASVIRKHLKDNHGEKS